MEISSSGWWYEGDLVVLNDNGTVQPKTSTAISSNFGLTNNGNKLYASSAGNNYSGPHSWPVHNATNGYLFVTNEGGSNIYHRIKYGYIILEQVNIL